MKLDRDPISSLITRLAVPAGVGMLFSTLLTVVDTFYAGLLSATALAALSLASPLFFLVLTLGIGVAQATNALVGNRLGAGEIMQARRLALQSMSFAVVISSTASLVTFIIVPTLFKLMGGEEPYLQPAIYYMRVVLLGTIFFSLALVVNSILNTRGDTRTYRNTQIAGFFANIVLDPLFMFGFGMGVVGVAVATVLIQACVFLYMLSVALKLDFMQKSSWREVMPDLHSFKEVAAQSLPTSISMSLVAMGSIIIVTFITRFGEPAMAAYAVALRLEQVILLPVIGLNMAALSLTGVNAGAGNWMRVREIHATSTRYALAVMVIGGVLVFFLGGFFMQLFNSDAEVIAIGTTYLKFEAFILPAYAIIFLSAAILQGLKKPLIAMLFNFLRQVIGQLLLIWLALDYLGMDITGIWWSILTINWLLAAVMFMVVLKLVRAGGREDSLVVTSS